MRKQQNRRKAGDGTGGEDNNNRVTEKTVRCVMWTRVLRILFFLHLCNGLTSRHIDEKKIV
jgi:hypothetical protein